MIVNNVIITDETIIKTRQWYVANQQACIEEARSGTVKVNDLYVYEDRCNKNITAIYKGKWDRTFAFMQRAYFIQTGKDLPLLSV